MTDPHKGQKDIEGIIYLIHLAQPICHAQHYLGWTGLTLSNRLSRHKTSNGSALLRAANKRGIDYWVVAAWRGTRHHERAMKRYKCAPKYCPVCNSTPRQFNIEGLVQLDVRDLLGA